MRHIKHPFLFSSLKEGRAISMKSKKKGFHFTPSDSGAPRIWQRGATTGGLGVKPPATNGLLWFSYKKTITLIHFFIDKGRAVSAVTTDNAKIFSLLISKIRSLAKISERRLQPLLVCEIID